MAVTASGRMKLRSFRVVLQAATSELALALRRSEAVFAQMMAFYGWPQMEPSQFFLIILGLLQVRVGARQPALELSDCIIVACLGYAFVIPQATGSAITWAVATVHSIFTQTGDSSCSATLNYWNGKDNE